MSLELKWILDALIEAYRLHRRSIERRSYHNNIEKQRARSRAYGQSHREKGNARSRKWNETHPERRIEIQRQSNVRRAEEIKQWASEHPERVKEKQRRYNQTAKAKQRWRRYRERHPEKYKEICRNSNRQKRELAKIDPVARLERKLRNDLRKRLKYGKHGHRSWDLIGCTVEELKRHIESQFEPGMTWENWGYRGWHIDHRTPLASFDLSKSEQVKAAFHFTNLQPLWAGQNLRKGAKLDFAVN